MQGAGFGGQGSRCGGGAIRFGPTNLSLCWRSVRECQVREWPKKTNLNQGVSKNPFTEQDVVLMVVLVAVVTYVSVYHLPIDFLFG